jgi:hypothetical protein
MAIINSREMVDKIIAANGKLAVIKIVEYNNQFNDALAYGLIFEGTAGEDYYKYEDSPACHNPVVIFERRQC